MQRNLHLILTIETLFTIIGKRLFMIRREARGVMRPSEANSVAAELNPFLAVASLKRAPAKLKLTPRWSVGDERFTHVARSLLLIGYSGRHLETHLSVSANSARRRPKFEHQDVKCGR
jgi:hypothetical protein